MKFNDLHRVVTPCLWDYLTEHETFGKHQDWKRKWTKFHQGKHKHSLNRDTASDGIAWFGTEFSATLLKIISETFTPFVKLVYFHALF